MAGPAAKSQQRPKAAQYGLTMALDAPNAPLDASKRGPKRQITMIFRSPVGDVQPSRFFCLPPLQDSPRGLQDSPNTTQQAPKMAPRWPNTTSRRPRRRS
eukprot:617361-Pyramimonas_sp.AAC.1